MRKILKKASALLLAALLVGGLRSAEADEYIIDVVEGVFISGGYSVPLEEGVERPIAISYREGEARVSVSSPDGQVDIVLGEGHIALTDRAVPHAREAEETCGEDSLFTGGEACEICGRTTAIGNHAVLPCGHQGCLMAADHLQYCTACGRYKCNGKNHSICEHCDVKWCVHVDLECEYTRNPTPTQAPYDRDEGGAYVQGFEWDSDDWTPGEDLLKSIKKKSSSSGNGNDD